MVITMYDFFFYSKKYIIIISILFDKILSIIMYELTLFLIKYVVTLIMLSKKDVSIQKLSFSF